MLSRKIKLKSLHVFMVIMVLFGLFLPGLVFAAGSANTKEDSTEETKPGLANEFIVNEAYLTDNAIGNINTNLVLNVSHNATLTHINVYDRDDDLSGYLRDSSVNNNRLDAGQNRLSCSTNYCPSFATPNDCVFNQFDLPDGVYNLEVRIA